MKGIVAYDSVNGNTRQVAEAIADEARKAGHEVETYYLKESIPPAVQGDFLFVGSPTRGGKPTKRTMEFLAGLDAGWSGPIFAFDTVGPLSKDPAKRREWLEQIGRADRNAASRIAEACRGRGLRVCPELMHIAVVGMWGPLAPDALDMARAFTRRYLERMK